MSKQTVGVFFGSRSAEHDVSIVTAIAAIIKPLWAAGDFDVVPVYVAKDGKWYSHPKLAEIKTYQSSALDDLLKKIRPVQLELGQGLQLVHPGLRPRKVAIDIAFPAMHGTHGEDGELMGIFEMAGIPYVGCDVAASAIAMNKVTSKLIAEAHGIKTPAFQFFTKVEFETEPEQWVKGLLEKSQLKDAKLPWFVKPAHLGSSIGITRVDKQADLRSAIEVAAHYDDLILVEEGVRNLIEVTVPIMGNENPRAANVERPLTTAEDFFDFDTKYLGQGGKKGGGQKGAGKGAQGYSQVPADLPKELYDECVATALKSYKAIGCSGTARVDLLIDSSNDTVYFNEVNPLPGSLYSHNWAKAGVSAVELVSTLIRLATERQLAKAKLSTAFETSFLKQF